MKNTLSKTKKKYLIVATFILILSFVLVFAYQDAPDKVQATRREEIQRLIAKAALVHADKQEVIRFLDARHIEHSPYDKETGVILAIVRNTSRGFLTEGSIQIVFSFGNDEKLSGYRLKDIYTGL